MSYLEYIIIKKYVEGTTTYNKKPILFQELTRGFY